MILKQGVIYKRKFKMVLSSDHITGATGKTVAVELSKGNDAAGSAAAGAVTELDAANLPGIYQIALTNIDTNTTGDLAIHCTAAACDATDFVDQVQTTIFPDLTLDASGNVSIASSIKKNQALNGFQFVMTDSTTHAPKTGLVVTAQRSLGGAGFSPCTNPVVEMSNGVYVINLSASDLNSNSIIFRFTAVGADDLNIEILTQP